MKENYPPLIVILGPTASGKTDIAIKLALEIDGEIVSADSRQIYKEIDIGTAKPSSDELKAVPHHLVDIININDEFTMNDFQEKAMEYIMDIYKRGKRPILAGGTALYIKALTEGLDVPVTPPDYELREELKKMAEKEGTRYLHDLLKEVDPSAWKRIHYNDLRRIIRAFEVYYSTACPISTLQEKRKEIPFDVIKFGLNWPREELYKRIDERVELMFDKGLVDEVTFLVSRNYIFEGPPLDALGYLEVYDYLKGKATMGEAKRLIKRNTRHFSKRQMTWFRKDKDIHWIIPEIPFSPLKILEEIKSFLEGKQ